uniref:Putative ion channel nompc n=1 Tax=Anopheles darlingi TaxID=43151 RepID=A0A2M4CVJ7_ANODA
MADSRSPQNWRNKNAAGRSQRKRKLTNDVERSSKNIKTVYISKDVAINEAYETLSKPQLDMEYRKVLIQTERHVSYLREALQDTPYQLKLAIVIGLVNGKKSMDIANNFNFTVTAEDLTSEISDDIVYTFNDNGRTGTLMIHAQHSDASRTPKIKLNDFASIQDISSPFNILKYFKSFYDKPRTAGIEGVIICTNSDIDDGARDLWRPVDLSVMVDPTPLEFFISTLLTKLGAKCYRLDFDSLTYGKFNQVYQTCKKYSKCYRLAKLLVNAVKSENHRLTKQNPVVKEYYHAILSIIDKNDSSVKGSYKFTDQFLNSSLSNSTPGYEAFRLEFEEEYSQLINVWEDLKNKRMHVDDNFLPRAAKKEDNELEFVFPENDVDRRLVEFCERFRLVCYTKSENELDDTIIELWKDMYSIKELTVSTRRGNFEKNIKLKTSFDGLLDLFFKPLNSEDIERDHRNIENVLAVTKLESASYQLRREIVRSTFRISPDTLQASYLYRHIYHETLLELDVYDICFGTVVLSDIISLQGKNPREILFIKDSVFYKDSEKVKSFFYSFKQYNCLIIICHEMFMACQGNIRKWREDISQKPSKQIFLVRKTNNIHTDLNYFSISDVTKESWEKFLGTDIPLCSTSISPSKVFQDCFYEFSIEELIMWLDWGKQMEQNNAIVKKYRQIRDIYVHRKWINEEEEISIELPQEDFTAASAAFLKSIRCFPDDYISFEKITKRIEQNGMINQIFPKMPNEKIVQVQCERVSGDKDRKMLILLGEAGCGKSMNLTWLAWHLLERRRSSWVIRCNLSDYCYDFNQFIAHEKNETVQVSENDALKMLYKLAHLSLVEMKGNASEKKLAQQCSECLFSMNNSARLSINLMKNHGLSLNNAILLRVFVEKFNASELVLLLDGFDEIAPSYKEVMCQFLSYFKNFKGIRNIYLTSRPYNFKEQMKEVFVEAAFFKLNPFSRQDKGLILIKMMKLKIDSAPVYITEIIDFYKALCVIVLGRLGDLSDNPLNLMMTIDIVIPLANQYVHFQNKKVSLQLLEDIEKIFKPTFIVEEFVNRMIRRHLYINYAVDNKETNLLIEAGKLEKDIEDMKLKHGLLALWVLFDACDQSERISKLLAHEERLPKGYMHTTHEAAEKTGIINGVEDGIPIFIHRTFAEYLGAWWIVKKRMLSTVPQKSKHLTCLLEDMLKTKSEILKHMHIILASDKPLHLAIVENDLTTAKSLLRDNSEPLSETDSGGRTAFHLLAMYAYIGDYLEYFPSSLESSAVNCKERVFGWTALDCAFEADKRLLIIYLLHCGALINKNILYKQVQDSAAENQVKICKAATYAKYFMEYLSEKASTYDSKDAKIMKEFCDEVIENILGESKRRDDTPYINNDKVSCLFENIIHVDSVWMLERIVEQIPKNFVQMYRESFFGWAMAKKSIFVLKYIVEQDKSFFKEPFVMDCLPKIVALDYKNEFKWFIDLYSSDLIKIKDFQMCSMESDTVTNLQFHPYDYNEIWDIVRKIGTYNLNHPIDTRILSLLGLCLAYGRTSMLKYLTKSCNLDLNVDLLCYLAKVTDRLRNMLSKIDVKRAYEYLLVQALNTGSNKVNDMFRNVIKLELFEFAKFLMKRVNIDYKTVDKLNRWNIFHWFVSLPLSDNREVVESMLDLFRCMIERTNMDCFGILDKKKRSILHIAIENDNRDIADFIIARKLQIENLKDIPRLGFNAINKLKSCCLAVHNISKSLKSEEYCHKVICMLADHIAFLLLSDDKRPSLEENADQLYQIAVECRSLFLMYYLHKEPRFKMSPSIHDTDWSACIAQSLESQNFELFKWVVGQYCLGHNIIHPKLNSINKPINFRTLQECDANKCYRLPVNVYELNNSIDRADLELPTIMKLLILAVCVKHVKATKYLCETFPINIDWKVLNDIMRITHSVVGRVYGKPGFDQVFLYLINHTSNIHELDEVHRNALHCAVENYSSCMARYLIEHNLFEVTTINEQNRWNALHYCASRKSDKDCCDMKSEDLFSFMLEWVLKNRPNTIAQEIKQLCFDSNDGSKSVIQIAFETGNINITQCIICSYLNIKTIDQHEIIDIKECSIIRECFDVLDQIAARLPFNAESEQLLDRIAKPIDRISREKIKNTDHVAKDACRAAIKYRSVSTLEYLITKCKSQMHRELTKSSSREIFACMMECIRHNKTNLFNMLARHYHNYQGFRSIKLVEYELEENDNYYETIFDEGKIQWLVVNQTTTRNWSHNVSEEYLPLLILSIAYGRMQMAQTLIQMRHLPFNELLVQLILKALNNIQPAKDTVAVLEYLAKKGESNVN